MDFVQGLGGPCLQKAMRPVFTESCSPHVEGKMALGWSPGTTAGECVGISSPDKVCNQHYIPILFLFYFHVLFLCKFHLHGYLSVMLKKGLSQMLDFVDSYQLIRGPDI